MAKKKEQPALPVLGVIYARYSSHNQKEESIEQQVEECTEFAKANNITIIDVYADKAISGRTDRRNSFQRLMRDAEKKKFSVVIAYKSNRISRDMLNALQIQAKLSLFGIKILYAKEEFEDTASGRFAMRTMMNVNQFYSENMAEDIRRGMRDNAQACKVNGTLPYGYKKGEDGKYAIDEPRAAIVREIFYRVQKGDRYIEIINDLNARGLKTKMGKPFNKNSFNRMLVNERYIGVYEHSGIRVEDGVPAIISKEVFYMVQNKLKEGENEQGLKRKLNSEYLLTGKLFCGECGAPMVGISGTSRTGELHYYYSCKNRRTEKKCPKHNIQRELLEQCVVDMTRECISDTELVNWLIKSYVDYKEVIRKNSDLAVMEEELKEQKKALSNIMKAIEDGIYTNTTAERMRELEVEIEIKEKAIELGNRIFDKPFSEKRFRWYLKRISEGNVATLDYRKDIFSTFVRRVRLWDDRIEIEYNFTGDEGDNNPYKAVKALIDNNGDDSSSIRTDTAKSHQ